MESGSYKGIVDELKRNLSKHLCENDDDCLQTVKEGGAAYCDVKAILILHFYFLIESLSFRLEYDLII